MFYYNTNKSSFNKTTDFLAFLVLPCYTIPRCKARYTQAVTGSLLCTLRRKPRSIGLAADSRRKGKTEKPSTGSLSYPLRRECSRPSTRKTKLKENKK